jgi:mycothione reductase
MLHFDMIILGTGIGLTLLEAGIQNHLKCALIEPGKFGGTCLTRGCIPSKVLTTSADAIRQIQDSFRIGIESEVQDIDIQRIYARMWQQIDQSVDIENNLQNLDQLQIYKGYGEFTGTKTLRVNFPDGRVSEEMTADTIILSIGARPFIPPIEGLEQAGYLTYETFFEQRYPDKYLRRITILGAGAIGAEFAHFFSAMGLTVTLIEAKDRILPLEEPEISQFIHRNFTKNGIRVVTDIQVERVVVEGNNKTLVLKNPKTGSSEEISCDEIFIATGIRSNADQAKVHKSGIKMNERGWVVTDDYLRTNIQGIWALGDINGKFQFRHKANYEGEICVHNIFNPSDAMKRVSYESVPWAVFTHPQVAHVGVTLEQALKTHKGVYVGTKYYSSIAKGFALGYETGDEDDGFVKLIADEDYRILGAHIAGSQAAILIQSYVYLMNAACSCIIPRRRIFSKNNEGKPDCPKKGSLNPMRDSMVIHPALSELTAWVLSEMKWVEM